MDSKSLQETYAPDSACFGCGPRNDKGLRIRSFVEGDGACVCVWRPQPHHLAFPGALNGGICGVGTDRACPGPTVPVARPASPHLDPAGALVPSGPR